MIRLRMLNDYTNPRAMAARTVNEARALAPRRPHLTRVVSWAEADGSTYKVAIAVALRDVLRSPIKAWKHLHAPPIMFKSMVAAINGKNISHAEMEA